MKSQTRDNLFLLISISLDGRLSDHEQAELNAIIAGDATAREILETVRAVKFAMQSAPRQHAPRNFTLSRSYAQSIHQKAKIFPIFRFTSAFSTVAAIFLFAFSYLIQNPAASQSLQSAPAPALMSAESSDTTSNPYQVNGQPIIITWNNSGGIGGGGAADMAGTKLLAEGMSEESVAPELLSPAAPPALQQVIQSTTEALSADTLPEITGSGPILGVSNKQVENSLPGRLSTRSLPIPLNGWAISGLIATGLALLTGMFAFIFGREKYH